MLGVGRWVCIGGIRVVQPAVGVGVCWVRVIRGLQPPAIVVEPVPGSGLSGRHGT